MIRQLLLIKMRNLRHQLIKIPFSLKTDLRFFISAATLFTRHVQSQKIRQFFHCFEKFQFVVFHQKTDGITVRATTETMIKLLTFAYCK